LLLKRRITSAAGLTLLGCALTHASPAAAATKTVTAGPNAKLGNELVINDFFRNRVTVRAGDSVQWRFLGFHNVLFPKKGSKPPELLAPDPATPIAGLLDAAGQPFFFNGQPRITADPQSAFPQGGKTYDGSTLTGSGLPDENAKPYKLKFPKTGSFTYYCTVHPGMKGTVKVVSKRRRIPSAAQDRAAAAKQLKAAQKRAASLKKLDPPAATVSGGSDKGSVAWLRFFPKTLRVGVGQPVKVEVKGSQEIHTFSFGPQAYLEDIVKNQIVPVPNPAGPPSLVFDARVVYPSDPPPFRPYAATSHGNGFFSTGVLGKGAPGGSSSTISFSAPGAYRYMCLIHPEMVGTINVQ
jgi:plastocyanin